jgi:hypothetical protein
VTWHDRRKVVVEPLTNGWTPCWPPRSGRSPTDPHCTADPSLVRIGRRDLTKIVAGYSATRPPAGSAILVANTQRIMNLDQP